MAKPHLKIVPCSCHCGGNYAWVRVFDQYPPARAAEEMIGCVCHHTPFEISGDTNERKRT